MVISTCNANTCSRPNGTPNCSSCSQRRTPKDRNGNARKLTFADTQAMLNHRAAGRRVRNRAARQGQVVS